MEQAVQIKKGKKKKGKKKHCPHAGSNYGPPVYKTGALPLSYKGNLLDNSLNYLINGRYKILTPAIFADT